MFKTRSYQKEILDDADIQRDLLFQNLKELEFINKYLGGHRVSIRGLKEVLTSKTKTYSLFDIGCGGGDSLKAIDKWAVHKGVSLSLTGIDLKSDCIEYAEKNCMQHKNISFRCDDFRNSFVEHADVDVVHAALFCHHFTEKEISEFIKLCGARGAIFVINDLERNPIAYYAIKILTALFSKSPLVKNDAPLSVLRGFKRIEWQAILKESGIKKYTIKNRWAFRHLVIIYPNGY
ncbi:MAG: methyltransferase domain-containing protein [bacterium]|nr:methyltransferase domain-containing protein [bacterium]